MPTAVACPNCQSNCTNQVGTVDRDLVIYACQDCQSQFSVTIARTEPTKTSLDDARKILKRR